MSDKKTEKLEPASTSVEQKALATADAQQARNADAAQVAQIQDSNPNKSSGSAGGENPHKSLEVVGLDYIISRNSKLTGKDVAEIEARRQSITKGELNEKAQAGDGQARDLISYFAEAEKLPQGPVRDKALAVQQTNADRTFGRGEFATRKAHAESSEPTKLSDTAAELQTRALDNPALAPVAGLRAYADKLPEGEEKDRLMRFSKQEAAHYVPEIAARYEGNGQFAELSVSAEILPKSESAKEESSKEKVSVEELTNSPEGWFKVGQRIAQLPLEQQVQVLGAGLLAGVEQYQREQRERALGSLVGTVQGVGTVAENLAKVADFGAALILNDKEKAGKLGDEFGKSVGETIVSGVQLFRAADAYFYDVGYTGDYAKPFRDIVRVGAVMNTEWASKSPFEQERIKSKFVSELLADGVVGGAAAGAIKKATKITEVIDIVASEAKVLHGATEPTIKKAVHAINNVIDDVMQPAAETTTGLNIKLPKEKLFLEDYYLKMEKKAASGEPPEKIWRGDDKPHSAINQDGGRKAHVNMEGDLCPANIKGVYKGKSIEPGEHIDGRWNTAKKSHSPYISFSANDNVAQWGKHTITLDMNGLRTAIAKGELKDIEILDLPQILRSIDQSSAFSEVAKVKLRARAIRSNEVLIKGKVPGRFFTVTEQN